jgi:N-dimethylarginine dimethylaminohydrolase
MIRLLIEPTTFEILPMQEGQNPYIDIRQQSHNAIAKKQFTTLAHVLRKHRIIYKLPAMKKHIPDIVFVANGGLSLPRLGRPLILLPNMKWPQRKEELPYLEAMYRELGIPTIPFPGKQPFEGQAELKWFDGGRKAVCGYGYRATRKAYTEIATLFEKLYGAKNAPELLVLPIASVDYYHLDFAMIEYSGVIGGPVDRCIVHRRAFSPASHRRLAAFLGPENVTIIDTNDTFSLNAIVDGSRIITHEMKDPLVAPFLEKCTGREIVQIPISEYEKSGGSIRCLVLDLYLADTFLKPFKVSKDISRVV